MTTTTRKTAAQRHAENNNGARALPTAKPVAARIVSPASRKHDALLAAIAKQHLDLDTLETQRGGVDFQEQAVWCIKAALEAAYEAGRRMGAAQAAGTV